MTHTLTHGGQLQAIAQQYAIPIIQWLDLSTGIAPMGYPVGPLPALYWQRLPQPCPTLLKAAQDYYGSKHLLPIAGSQSLIQILPQICQQHGYANSQVWIPQVGYKEHQKAWQNAGYRLQLYTDLSELCHVTSGDIVLLINPNNPSGELLEHDRANGLYQKLKAKQALLIVDEAFMDGTPQHSLINALPCDKLIILRSVGKFFGLAGIRLGFVAASPKWLNLFAQALGPWAINGPAQYVGAQALADNTWQQQQRHALTDLSLGLAGLLQQHFNQIPRGTLLFQTIHLPHAPQVFDALCQQGVYVRLCDEQNALRFGIPDKQGLLRLAQVLALLTVKR